MDTSFNTGYDQLPELSQKHVCKRMSQKLSMFFGLPIKDLPTFPKRAWCLRKVKDRSDGEACTFKDFRIFTYDRGSNTFQYIFKDEQSRQRAELNEVYSQPHSSDDLNAKQQIVALYLLPILLDDKHARLRNETVTYRPMEFKELVLCDGCRTCIFSESYFCTQCGQEWCYCCANSPPVRCHERAMLMRLTRFRPDEIEDLIASMQRVPKQPPTAVASTSHSRRIRRYGRETLTETQFASIWAEHRPLVVTGIDECFQTAWTPDAFTMQFREMSCQVEDCESGENTTWKVGEFFSLFGQSCSSSRRSLKLKDWPPKDRFRQLSSKLQHDFDKAVPMPSYTSSSGVRNLAAHFPDTDICPDLGPKMYNALSTVFDDAHTGSTRLHLDLSDAVNIMMWASDTQDSERGYALWHIFAVEDASQIRRYLHAKARSDQGSTEGDPIHNQETYLTPSMLQELLADYNTRPYTIRQHVGEAVFIPAGCAHQVCNQADCIKVACDFISPESVPTCQRLSEEFRMQRLVRGWPEDVIPFHWMLYYTWLSTTLTQTTMSRRAKPNHTKKSDISAAKSYHCPVCSPAATRPYVAGKRFAFAGGLLDHITNVHGINLDKSVSRDYRKLPADKLAERLLKHHMR